MKVAKIVLVLFLGLVFTNQSTAQETLPIYTDYLSDNVYLLHPAAAGIGNCGKIRVTARQQWAGVKDAPTLQTLSFHNRFAEESKAAFGFVAFNDKNGYHSQKGLQGTFAYHLDMYRGGDFNQLSFGLSFSAIQNEVDQTTFTGDPTVQQLIESDFYFNADFGMAYHLGGFSSYFTVKNLLLSAKGNTNTNFESLNLRNYIVSAGYFFGNEAAVQFEPSLMFQYKERTGETLADFNLKVYKTLDNLQLWTAVSYRRSFEENPIEPLQHITPVVGVNFEKFMFSYTYTKQIGDVLLTDTGFHQISLGLNIGCRSPRASACPNINSSF